MLPVHVIAVQSEDADDQSEALTAAIRSRVRALRGFSLADSDFALEVLTLGLKCDANEEVCQSKIGDHIHADRYVWGAVKRSKNHRQIVADLHLWTRGRPPGRTQLTYSDNLTAPGDEALKRLVEDALGKLFEPSKVASSAPSASSPVSAAPLLSSYDVAARIRTDAAPRAPVDAPDDSSGDTHRTAGWAGLGLGGVLLGASIYSIVRVHAINTDDRVALYRQGFHSDVDVCDQARAGVDSKVTGSATPTEMRDFCSEATTFQTLQYVFLGLGAVSAGAGIYLLATDKGGNNASTRVTVAPSIGRNSGQVHLSVSF